MEKSDGDLIAQYRGGDIDALEALVLRHRRSLYGYIFNMTGNAQDADEIFQEVWFRAIRSIARYRQQNFGGWLMRIARNLVVDRARRRKPTVSLDREPTDGSSLHQVLPDGGPDASKELADNEVGRAIAEAATQLPIEQREVFLMRVQAQLPFKEIARIQNVSINTALARMQYALARLRPMLKGHYEELGR